VLTKLQVKKVLISERNQRTKIVKGKKVLLALSASLSINLMRKADTRLEESKASATDRVIGLIIPCHTPFRERGNKASIRVSRMFKSHA
jgi:hypothetical protein